MKKQQLIQIESDLTFYLQTHLQLQTSSIRTIWKSLRPLLQADILINRDTFYRHCLHRQQMGISNHTLNRDVAAVKHYLNYTQQTWSNMTYFPRLKNQYLAPQIVDIQRFLNVRTSPTWDMFWQLHIFCGTRPGEVISLRRCDINLKHHYFQPQRTKTNDGLPIAIPDFVVNKLRYYLDHLPSTQNYLFINRYTQRPLTLSACRHDCFKRWQLLGYYHKFRLIPFVIHL